MDIVLHIIQILFVLYGLFIGIGGSYQMGSLKIRMIIAGQAYLFAAWFSYHFDIWYPLLIGWIIGFLL